MNFWNNLKMKNMKLETNTLDKIILTSNIEKGDKIKERDIKNERKRKCMNVKHKRTIKQTQEEGTILTIRYETDKNITKIRSEKRWNKIWTEMNVEDKTKRRQMWKRQHSLIFTFNHAKQTEMKQEDIWGKKNVQIWNGSKIQ